MTISRIVASTSARVHRWLSDPGPEPRPSPLVGERLDPGVERERTGRVAECRAEPPAELVEDALGDALHVGERLHPVGHVIVIPKVRSVSITIITPSSPIAPSQSLNLSSNRSTVFMLRHVQAAPNRFSNGTLKNADWLCPT